MPKYGPAASRGWDNKEIQEEFGLKCGFGPPTGENDERGHPKLKWNRCWFDVPCEWIPDIRDLFNKIKAKYVIETIDMDENDPRIQVRIDQIKCKYGSLRFYYSASTYEIDEDIEKMVEECEIKLAVSDPTYGEPY